MNLVYWICDCRNDSSAYSIRAKTRKEALAERESSGNPEDFSKPRKVEIQYKNALDLVQIVLSESGEGYASLIEEDDDE